MLILLDIDGTLLHGSPRAHAEALVGAMVEVHGISLGIGDVAAIRPGGRTDREIVRLVLSAAGTGRAEVDRGMEAVMAGAATRYPAAQADSPPRAAPDAALALERLARAGVTLALLTGNLEPIARAKMAHVGLAGFFPAGEGAFGSDHERRDELVPVAIARARAASRCAEPAVVVGDTPRDVACARAGGARCVAVTTGPHPAAELADADAVVSDLSAAADVILGWRAGGYPSSARRARSKTRASQSVRRRSTRWTGSPAIRPVTTMRDVESGIGLQPSESTLSRRAAMIPAQASRSAISQSRRSRSAPASPAASETSSRLGGIVLRGSGPPQPANAPSSATAAIAHATGIAPGRTVLRAPPAPRGSWSGPARPRRARRPARPRPASSGRPPRARGSASARPAPPPSGGGAEAGPR